MSKIKGIVIALVFVLIIVAIGVWHYSRAGHQVITHSLIIQDRSRSTRDPGSCTETLAARAIADPHNSSESTLTVTVTGDASTNNEPRVLTHIQIPFNKKILEGRETVVQQQQKILADLIPQCQKVIPATTSPIYMAVKRGIEELRTLGCKQDGYCALYLVSDLAETEEPSIRRALNGSQPAITLPTPIDNAGIDIIVVNTAATVGTTIPATNKRKHLKVSSQEHVDRVRAVWLRLFTDPTRVQIEPHCFGK